MPLINRRAAKYSLPLFLVPVCIYAGFAIREKRETDKFKPSESEIAARSTALASSPSAPTHAPAPSSAPAPVSADVSPSTSLASSALTVDLSDPDVQAGMRSQIAKLKREEWELAQDSKRLGEKIAVLQERLAERAQAPAEQRPS